MRLIQNKLGNVGNNLKEQKQYKPRLQLSTTRATRVRQPTFDQGISSSVAPPPPHGFDPNAFFHPQRAYFGMQPHEYFNPVPRAINSLIDNIQRLTTGHEAMYEDVRGLRTDIGGLNASVGRLSNKVGALDQSVQILERTHAFVYQRRHDSSAPSHYPISPPSSPLQE